MLVSDVNKVLTFDQIVPLVLLGLLDLCAPLAIPQVKGLPLTLPVVPALMVTLVGPPAKQFPSHSTTLVAAVEVVWAVLTQRYVLHALLALPIPPLGVESVMSIIMDIPPAPLVSWWVHPILLILHVENVLLE